MALVWKKTAPKIWSKVIQSKSKKSGDTVVASAEARAEYRRTFLDGLKFYCESPSLILNSDLPADLVEYVTSQGFPIEALGIILEAKKLGALSSRGSSESHSTELKPVTDTLRFSEISRKLVEEWMTSDSCSEAFVSLSIGEEIPGILAETSNFQRILFTIVDVFHLNGREFLRFLLQQCLLILATLTHAVREDAVFKIRTQPLSSFLDRIFLRFHSDSEHFRPDLTSTDFATNNPFAEFCSALASTFENDFIGKRMLTKTLLSLGNVSVTKIAKIFTLIGRGKNCALSILLQPSEQFLSENSVWKHALLINIPFKTVTQSLYFWSNWAAFLFCKGSSSVKTEIWSNCVKNWTSLCNNTYLESKLLIPASFALIALAREVKRERSEQESTDEEKVTLLSVMNIFESITKCLDSTDDAKRSCGMAVAQIVAELHFPKKSEEFTKLEFESQSDTFKLLMNYYNSDDVWMEDNKEEKVSIPGNPNITGHQEVPILRKSIKVLDSDDEEPEEDPDKPADLDESPYEPMGEEEFPIDERLQSLRLTGKRIPVYFSEITECLIGDGKSRDEAEKEALKEVAVLKIPVLLSYGVRIDANMASLISRMLIEMEGGRILEIPIIFALFEISSAHPFEVYDALAATTFDKEHHTVGHRMVVLSRYSEIVQLVSRQKCFSCYSAPLQPLSQDLSSLTPDFMNTYFDSRKNFRHCKSCVKKLQAIEGPVENKSLSVVPVSGTQNDSISHEDHLELSWREIVDRRIASKTRYFVTPRKKTILIPDEYSAKLVPIVWSSLANRLANRKDFFLASIANDNTITSSINDMLLAHVFRVLGRIILGTAGPHCVHLRNISAQVGDLVSTFIIHKDKLVRRAVLSLLAITVTTGEGKSYIIEALSNQENLLEKLKSVAQRETDSENKELFSNTLAYITASAFVGAGLQVGQSDL